MASGAAGPADRAVLSRLVAAGVMVAPFFGQDDGLFPGRAGRGRIVGTGPLSPVERFTLAVLYAALLTVEMLEALPPARTIVLDGTFVREPLYGALVQALVPRAGVRVNRGTYGLASGAALLAGHASRQAPMPLDLDRPDIAGLPDLEPYRVQWRALSAVET